MTPAETSRNEEIGINRNILECKDQSSFFSYRAKVSINRNILECKALPDNQRLHPKSVLIETYWNVKTAIWETRDLKTRINRNILECKEIKKIQRSNGNKGINRNILECKGWYVWRRDVFRYRINRNILECKVCRISLVKLDISVLIETYWNVKAAGIPLHYGTISINRNILECKDGCPTIFQCRTLWVLIETYWNVKAIQESAKNALESGINRNILECKVILCPTQRACFFVLIETYWNVKIFAVISVPFTVSVSIETYWNVKMRRRQIAGLTSLY